MVGRSLSSRNVRIDPRSASARFASFVVVCGLLGAAATGGAVQPVYEIVALPGLTDVDHTDAEGHHFSRALALDGTGLVFGTSQRFPPGAPAPIWHGVTGWVFDPETGTTSRAALDADPFAPVEDLCSNGVAETTAAGFGLGVTLCGSGVIPDYLWAFDSLDRATTFIGLSGPDHANPVDGNPLSQPLPFAQGRISASGHVAGSTTRWLPAPGSSAWLYDSTTRSTARIGLFDADHVSPDGTQYSIPLALSGTGHVAGESDRYVAGSLVGASAWIHRPGTAASLRVGFYDGDGRGSAGFSAADGTQETTIAVLTESAYAAGSSVRFQGTETFGEVAWRYRIADDSMVALGLVDAAHTRDDGARSSGIIAASDSGHVLGSSTRYDGGPNPLSTSPWLYDDVSQGTKAIGLFDADHTSASGIHANQAHVLTESGFVAGSASRLGIGTPGESQGTSVWIARTDAPTTTRIGLVDAATLGGAQFTSQSGEQTSGFLALLESGDVLGSSVAFLADQPIGTAAWRYDAGTDTTTPIGLYGPGFTAPDGTFSNAPTHWTESGFVAGQALRDDFFPTLWIYSSATQTVDEIAPPTQSGPGGYFVPEILFLTDDGTVLGRFTLFDGVDPNGIVRFFAWTPDGGTIYLDERISNGFASTGWVEIESIAAIEGDRILGSGWRANGDLGGWMLVPVPEPHSTSLVGLAGLVAAGRLRRRHRAGRARGGRSIHR